MTTRWGDIFAQSQTITLAAREEALRWGHPEIDVEHVLLALVAGDGAAGRLLRGRGVTLDRARAAVEQTHAATLAQVGITTPVVAPRAVPDPLAGDVQWSAAGTRVLREPGDGSSDLPILRALLAEPTGFVVEVLGRLDVTARDLEAAMDEAAEAPGQARGDRDAGWRSVTTTAFVPADPVRIWELVSDPRRRPEWDTMIGSAVPVGDGLWQLEAAPIRPDGRRARVPRRYRRSRLRLIDSVPGQAVEWETTWPDQRRPVVHRLRIDVTAAEGGGRIELRLAMARPRGWRGALHAGPAALQRFVARHLLIAQGAGIARVLR